jgi:hypothetical protein
MIKEKTRYTECSLSVIHVTKDLPRQAYILNIKLLPALYLDYS